MVAEPAVTVLMGSEGCIDARVVWMGRIELPPADDAEQEQSEAVVVSQRANDGGEVCFGEDVEEGAAGEQELRSLEFRSSEQLGAEGREGVDRGTDRSCVRKGCGRQTEGSLVGVKEDPVDLPVGQASAQSSVEPQCGVAGAGSDVDGQK